MEKDKKGRIYLIIVLTLLILLSLVAFFYFKGRENNNQNNEEPSLVTVEEYKDYIQTLENNKLNSVKLAKNKLLNIAENQELNSEFLDEFEQFLNTVGSNLKVEEITEEDLNDNGFILEHNEGEITIETNYQYLYNTFKDKTAKVKTDYYNLKSTIFEYADSNHLYKDAELGVDWNEYREILIMFDNYLKEYEGTAEQKEEFNRLFGVYIGDPILDNTPIYDSNGKLKSEIKQSYEYLLENNADFSRYDELETHYNAHK